MLSIRRKLLGVAAASSLAIAPVVLLHAADEVAKPAEAKPGVVPALPVIPRPSSAEQEITLSVGKPAPAFAVGSWVKGEPVEGLKKGQVYVVEFWATWCGPCLAGMPHISKLQDEYGEKVRIIGISREKEEVVREWLPKEREEGVTWDQTVTYSLAMDTAENQMYDTWFRAAGRTGIPSAFLVGVDGVIEWIGHPARIDEPLAKVIDGSWDRPAAIAAYAKEIEQMKAQAEARKIQTAMMLAIREKNWDQALTLADEIIAKTPENPSPKLTKLSIYGMSGNNEAAAALLDELVKSDWDKAQLLPTIALNMASGRFPGSLDEAERLAKRAVEVIGDKSYIGRHALAKVYAEKGQLDDAIAWERKALELNEANVVVLRTLRELEAKKEGADKPVATPEN